MVECLNHKVILLVRYYAELVVWRCINGLAAFIYSPSLFYKINYRFTIRLVDWPSAQIENVKKLWSSLVSIRVTSGGPVFGAKSFKIICMFAMQILRTDFFDQIRFNIQVHVFISSVLTHNLLYFWFRENCVTGDI